MICTNPCHMDNFRLIFLFYSYFIIHDWGGRARQLELPSHCSIYSDRSHFLWLPIYLCPIMLVCVLYFQHVFVHPVNPWKPIAKLSPMVSPICMKMTVSQFPRFDEFSWFLISMRSQLFYFFFPMFNFKFIFWKILNLAFNIKILASDTYTIMMNSHAEFLCSCSENYKGRSLFYQI